MIAENKYYSYQLGELPLGCQQCVRGEKLVVFMTGLCPRKCYFCPVSDKKYGKDVTFANERKVQEDRDLLKEAALMSAEGAGITGGDPLIKLERTIRTIRLFKQHFGKKFHTHLYTSLNLVTESSLAQLAEAGLDEIRFHLDLKSRQFWPKLKLARKFSWKIGVELPMLPHKQKEILQVASFIKDKVDFFNLNELEVADNHQSKLGEMGFHTKSQLSYAVAGSLDSGKSILQRLHEERYPLSVHLCTAKLKDAVQFANRLKREAQGMRRPFDLVTKEGMLIRGALYLPELAPGFSYHQKLASPNKTIISALNVLCQNIKQQLQLSEEDIFLDQAKPRILISRKMLRQHRKLWKKLGVLAAIVQEYPTADQLEIEVEFV